MLKKHKKTLIALLVIITFFGVRALLVSDDVLALEHFESFIAPDPMINEIRYTEYIDAQDASDVETLIGPVEDAIPSELVNRVALDDSENYHSDVFLLNREDTLTYEVFVETTGLYQIVMDAFYQGNELFSPKFGVLINDHYPFYESRQTTFPIPWAPIVDQEMGAYQSIHLFDKDRYGHDIQPRSTIKRVWLAEPLRDASYIHHDPLFYHLEAGVNTITIIARNNATLIGDLRLQGAPLVLSYQDYLNQYSGASKPEKNMTLEAQFYDTKSDPSIKLYADQNPGSYPFSTRVRKLNAVDAYTFDEAGRYISYAFIVPEAGLYQISLKYLQYRLANIASFREIKINGEVPFQEMKAYPFEYTTQWRNETLQGEDGAYWFYLEEGRNTLTLVSSVEPYRPIIETIENVMRQITELSIEIRQLTGGQTDAYRDWDLLDFMPDVDDRLLRLSTELREAYRYGHTLNKTTTPAAELVNLSFAAERLERLAGSPNRIPNNMTLLSEGTTSAAQYLGDLMLRLTRQPLGLEKLYIHAEDFTLPSARANAFERVWTSIQKFFLTFLPKQKHNTPPAQTIEVWVNRPRANIDLMQKMIDEEFTPQSGIHVNLSLMPNPTKLILANAANIEPDVAMGVTNSTPYEFAIRNAAVDLRSFEGYEDVVSQFSPGVMIPYIFEDGVYGIPESQDFYLTYYRTDILSHVQASIPNTWDEVTAILPELRRLGMNYYVPLSGGASYKSFTLTSPFFFQQGASLYSEDGMRTTIDQEAGVRAMQVMSGLFSVHDLPRQVPNFYNHFRYGTLPIGIANATTYLQLTIAAPEIKGNWEVALFPGTIRDDVLYRYASAPTTGAMIFRSSKKQAMAFDFLSWWMSSETQTNFASDIQTMFGKEYMWFSANLDALASLPLDTQHRDIILEQLTWVNEAPNVPGGYYVEREISNAWNAMVFNDVNVRSAVDLAVVGANREMIRKLTEFGYVLNGQKVRNFPYPTLETIDDWLKGRG